MLNTFTQALRGPGRDAVTRLVGTLTGRQAGTPQTNDPAEQTNYHTREPLSFGLMIPAQDLRNGFVIPQAGAGRNIIPAELLTDPGIVAPMPDGRIIARPVARAGTDERAVIR